MAATFGSISHAVFNVRDIEATHQFWLEVMGWEQAGQIIQQPGYDGDGMSGALDMRFYRRNDRNHHDIAVAQLHDAANFGGPEEPDMRPLHPGVNHVAIRYDDREDWLAIVRRLEAQNYPIYKRVDHGMTHSIYVTDPDGNLFEILYDLPRYVWEGDVEAALQYGSFLEPGSPGYCPDSTDYRRFGD